MAHANLGPGESLLPGTQEAAAALLARDEVAAVLVPLVPQGHHALARAARRYVGRWDARLVHRQTWFAPAARVVTRAPLTGHRSAEAAPLLRDAIERGHLVEALRAPLGVATTIARDLDAWRAWARDEGSAWGALAARDDRFAPLLPARTPREWRRHNVRELPRRVIEALQALKRPDALALALHLSREAWWTRGAMEPRD